VYTTDGWKSQKVAKAGYAYSYPDGLEGWTFSATLPATVNRVQFAVSYSVAGNTAWDNNLGANYTASL
jgi:hypothetical protein